MNINKQVNREMSKFASTTKKSNPMNKNLRIFTLFAAVLATKLVFAQGIPDDPDLQNVAIPVDGGIFTVVGSAVAYGVYRLKNKNK
jgi:hypothetical protein